MVKRSRGRDHNDVQFLSKKVTIVLTYYRNTELPADLFQSVSSLPAHGNEFDLISCREGWKVRRHGPRPCSDYSCA